MVANLREAIGCQDGIDSHALFSQNGRNLLADGPLVGKDQPAIVHEAILRGPCQQDDLVRCRCRRRYGGDCLIAGRLQQVAPRRDREKRVIRAQRTIIEAPPAVRHAKCDVNPAAWLNALEEDEQPTRCERAAHVLQRLAQVCRCVQHIGSDHDVETPCEAIRRQRLRQRVALYIKQPVAHAAIGAEDLLGARGEEGRDIGKPVLHAVCRQIGQYVGGCRAAARADLQNAEAAP